MLTKTMHRPVTQQRKQVGILMILLLFTGVGIVLFVLYIGHWLNTPSSPTPADAIVIHGGSSERYPYGIELYQQGLAPELWITGLEHDVVTDTTRAARDLAIASGVPSDSIYLLATTSTWEDGREIAALAKEREKTHLLIVTSWWHSRRALCNDEHHLHGSEITMSFAAPAEHPVGPDNWWQSSEGRHWVSSELGKTVFYWLYYGLNPWTC